MCQAVGVRGHQHSTSPLFCLFFVLDVRYIDIDIDIDIDIGIGIDIDIDTFRYIELYI